MNNIVTSLYYEWLRCPRLLPSLSVLFSDISRTVLIGQVKRASINVD